MAQAPHLRPSVNLVRAHALRCATMADLYAKHGTIQRPIVILQRQMTAVRALVQASGGGQTLPAHGGWEKLTPYVNKQGPFDERRHSA